MKTGSLVTTASAVLLLSVSGCGFDTLDAATDAATTPAADPKICPTSPGSDPCTFGQTAIYRDSVRSGDVGLEITVDAPVEFELSEEAWILYDLEPGPVNVYFPITIKNTSPELPLSEILLLTQATNAEQGPYDGIMAVSDTGLGSINGQELLPGESRSIKVGGWSMATLDGVELEIAVDGLAGYDITFTE